MNYNDATVATWTSSDHRIDGTICLVFYMFHTQGVLANFRNFDEVYCTLQTSAADAEELYQRVKPNIQRRWYPHLFLGTIHPLTSSESLGTLAAQWLVRFI